MAIALLLPRLHRAILGPRSDPCGSQDQNPARTHARIQSHVGNGRSRLAVASFMSCAAAFAMGASNCNYLYKIDGEAPSVSCNIHHEPAPVNMVAEGIRSMGARERGVKQRRVSQYFLESSRRFFPSCAGFHMESTPMINHKELFDIIFTEYENRRYICTG